MRHSDRRRDQNLQLRGGRHSDRTQMNTAGLAKSQIIDDPTAPIPPPITRYAHASCTHTWIEHGSDIAHCPSCGIIRRVIDGVVITGRPS